MEVELDSDPVVALQNINTGVRFDVDVSNQTSPIETKTYVLAFIHKLLLQREKLRLGILKDYLGSGITILWHKVLETLESCGRMFLGIESGSLIFTLFCPTLSSAQELRDDSWIKSLLQKLKRFTNNIGQCINCSTVTDLIY